MKKLLVSAIVVATVFAGGLQTASAWKCEVHPEKPNCTPTTTVPVTAGKLIVLLPATAGSDSVMLPLVEPIKTIDIYFPLQNYPATTARHGYCYTTINCNG